MFNNAQLLNLKMIFLSVFIDGAHGRAVFQVCEVIVVATAAAVEKDSANFLFGVEVKAGSVGTARSGNCSLLKTIILIKNMPKFLTERFCN